jgi:hypothetical protein
MRVLSTFAILAFVASVLAFVACGSGNGADGGSTGQCSDIAGQICQKAATCSAGGDAGYTLIIVSPSPDSGIGSSGFTINGDQSHCDKFFNDLTCSGSHEAAFIAACGPAISGLQCGKDSMFGNGVVLPYPCSQNF